MFSEPPTRTVTTADRAEEHPLPSTLRAQTSSSPALRHLGVRRDQCVALRTRWMLKRRLKAASRDEMSVCAGPGISLPAPRSSVQTLHDLPVGIRRDVY